MKKNILYIIACGAMILAAAACSKEQANNEPQEGPAGAITESLSAQKEDAATKVTMDDATKVTMNSSRQFGWCDQDKAAFSIYNSSSYSFVDSRFYGDPEANKFTVSYTGTRQGYAVIPSTFAKTYDGTDLVVTYPASYDISADVAAGCYDNADDTHFIPFPMIAVSTPGNPALTFRSIGALVKVTMNHIPAGTKKVYVTFNQTVTGDFTVTAPATVSPSVSVPVALASIPSTVEIKISEAGLEAEKNIVLYIPVPTTTGLEISSSTETKASVTRNNGYAWSVNAITRVDASTEFCMGGYNFVLAPGNLVAHNIGPDDRDFFFFSGVDQIKTTKGNFSNDPHLDGYKDLNRPESGEYQDLFSWDDLYCIMTGAAEAPEAAGSKISFAGVSASHLEVEGAIWSIHSGNYFEHYYFDNYRDKRNTVKIRDNVGKLSAYVEIDVSGSDDYKHYALYRRAGGEAISMVSGRFVFPDGYVDQTDWIKNTALDSTTGSCEISSDAYTKMVNAGAIFLVQAGYFGISDNSYHITRTSGFGFYCGDTNDDGSRGNYIWGSHGNIGGIADGYRTTYRSVRLFRRLEL